MGQTLSYAFTLVISFIPQVVPGHTYNFCHFTDAKTEPQDHCTYSWTDFELSCISCADMWSVHTSFYPQALQCCHFLWIFFKLFRKSLASRLSLMLWQTPTLSKGERVEISGNHRKIRNLKALRSMEKGRRLRKNILLFKLDNMKI